MQQHFKENENKIFMEIDKFEKRKVKTTKRKISLNVVTELYLQEKLEKRRKKALDKIGKSQKNNVPPTPGMKTLQQQRSSKKHRNNYLAFPGPKEQKFINLGFRYSNKKEGSLDGKQAAKFSTLKS